MTIQWKVVEQYFTMVLLVFRFSSLCNFGKIDNDILVSALSGVKGLTGCYLNLLSTCMGYKIAFLNCLLVSTQMMNDHGR